MAWKKYSELSSQEKALRGEKKKVTNSIMSSSTKAYMKKQNAKRTISTDHS